MKIIICSKCGEQFEVIQNGIIVQGPNKKYYRADEMGCRCGEKIITNFSPENVKKCGNKYQNS